VLIVARGKDYYASPVFPMMFAGGAIAIEQLSERRGLRWLGPGLVVVILLGTLAFLPLMVPVLSPEAFLRYQAKLPFKVQQSEKSMAYEPLPHIYSWCFGWEEMVAAAAKAYAMVPPEERADTAIFANDFAEGGAVDLIGPKYGLPKAIGGHQSYWLWGPRNYSGQTIIVLGDTEAGARQWFDEVTVVEQLHNPYAPPWENKPVLLCRKPRVFHSLAEAWPQVKNWD
jgi:hypothetical protein